MQRKWANKAIQLVHGSVVLAAKKGEHEIRYTNTGKDPNHMTQKMVKAPFSKCIQMVKAKALKMGEGTEIWIHGASENTSDFVVRHGKIVKV